MPAVTTCSRAPRTISLRNPRARPVKRTGAAGAGGGTEGTEGGPPVTKKPGTATSFMTRPSRLFCSSAGTIINVEESIWRPSELLRCCGRRQDVAPHLLAQRHLLDLAG